MAFICTPEGVLHRKAPKNIRQAKTKLSHAAPSTMANIAMRVFTPLRTCS